MEYLSLMMILGIVSACLMAAYELLDGIEREDYEGSPRRLRDARVVVFDEAPPPFHRGSSPRSSEQQGDALPPERGAQTARLHGDAFDARIRGLGTWLEHLERECDRIEMLGLHADHGAYRSRPSTL